ncbi:queuosine precursor transporter [Candidatus Woesebacteria bacterium]|nr:queuosine precursor transporter [Candidatus Woesebacteria bacterium]
MQLEHKVEFLIMLYGTCIVVSELMGSKVIPLVNLFGMQFNASVALFTLPLIFTINDVIIEVCGFEKSKNMVRSGLVMIAFNMFFSLLVTILPPAKRFIAQNSAYVSVFSQSLRISFASLCAFALADVSDILIFQKLRKRLGTKRLWLRNNVSNIISQGIDTTVFMTLAFYSFSTGFSHNVTFLASIVLPYWLVKCCMSIIETPFVYLGVRWLRGGSKA